MDNLILGGEVVWRPDDSLVETSNLSRFMAACGISEKSLSGYNELLRKSAENPEWFWNAVIRHCDIRFYQPYERVLDVSNGKPWAKWCVGGATNLTLNCLDKHAGTPVMQKTAVQWEGENGETRSWTYQELNAHTCRLAEGLRAIGCGKGDVIGLFMPMIPEAAAAVLAVAKIGAIVLPLFSGFGPPAVASRLNDAGATALLTVDGTWRRGRKSPMKSVIDEVAKVAPTLRKVVVFKHVDEPIEWTEGRDHWWHELCEGRPETSPTEVMAADAPVMLMYTSGTTGKPKGTVHSHCGFITKLALDIGLCNDFKPSDRFLWMSDMGWMVGPLLIVSSTLLGGTMLMADGAPDYPDPGRMWRLTQQFRATILGISPTTIRGFMRNRGGGIENFDLSSLRFSISSGEAWTPEAWNWAFENLCRKRIPILNLSGGTEVGCGILIGTLLHPLKPCSFGGPVPGMGADVVNDKGESAKPGEVGELILRQPSIGMTRGLWHDPERYLDSYWNWIPGIWRHGDRALVDADGFWFILGRSDDTLKIAGKRTGPSEIEALLFATGKVVEAAAIGVPDPVKGEVPVCVCTVKPGVEITEALRTELSSAVVAGLGIPFRPKEILFVGDLPKTRNMKVMRRAVRAAYLGDNPGDLSSLGNPEALEEISRLSALALSPE